jgi:hypothetical protein
MLNTDNKKNFLRVLNIPIYERKDSTVLCYKFHDVIVSMTKISVTLKYGVTKYCVSLIRQFRTYRQGPSSKDP